MLGRIWVILICICLCTLVLIGCGDVSLDNDKSETENATSEENENVKQDDSEGNTKDMYKDKYEVKWDCGKFAGQIDDNSIEVKIIGKPDSFAPDVFRLEEEIKENFSKYDLNENDEIKFKYYINEYEQKVIIYIEKY